MGTVIDSWHVIPYDNSLYFIITVTFYSRVLNNINCHFFNHIATPVVSYLLTGCILVYCYYKLVVSWLLTGDTGW